MKYFSEIKCIPLMENSEKPKCVTMSWNSSIDGDRVEFQFIDSFMHLSQPLEVLIQNQANYQPTRKLSSHGEAFADFAQHIEMTNTQILKKLFPDMSLQYKNDKVFKMLLKKGVFPYAWFDNLNKLKRKKILSKEDFHNDLTKEHISDEEYQHYLNVMKTLQLNDSQEYLELYLNLDNTLNQLSNWSCCL